MIDRGFIKWQPFNALTTEGEILKELKITKKEERPTLLPDKIDTINKIIMEAYYSKSIVTITYFEDNKLKNIVTYIKKINQANNTITTSYKTLYFTQIVNIVI